MCASRALLRARATGGTRLERVTHGVPLRRCEAGDDHGRPVRVRRVSVLCCVRTSCRVGVQPGKIITMHTRIVRLTLRRTQDVGCRAPLHVARAPPTRVRSNQPVLNRDLQQRNLGT